MQVLQRSRYYVFTLISLNIALQVAAFCLIKFSWIYAHHSVVNFINYITILAFCTIFFRALIWQYLLKANDLIPSCLPNAVVPSLLLVAGYFVFNEKITFFNMLGSIIIFCGLILLFKSRVQA